MVRGGCDVGDAFTHFVALDEASGEVFMEKGLAALYLSLISSPCAERCK